MRNLLLVVLKVVCLKCSAGEVPVWFVWFELCGGCSPAAGCSLKEKDDDGGCMHPTRAVPQGTPEHFDV